MGQQFVDQYAYLHFAAGIVAYFLNISVHTWFLLHTVFELWENSPFGMRLINRMTFWPGGKSQADSVVNMLGDTVATLAGWASAYAVEALYRKHWN